MDDKYEWSPNPFTYTVEYHDDFKRFNEKYTNYGKIPLVVEAEPEFSISDKEYKDNSDSVKKEIEGFDKAFAELSLGESKHSLTLGEVEFPQRIENSRVSAREYALEIASTLAEKAPDRRAFILGLEKLTGVSLSLMPEAFISTLFRCPLFSGVQVDSVVKLGTSREVPYELDKLIESG